ncbi:UNVERIFIED_CONTAM: Dirigent protein 17 [Sesamum angustifolium]|uniref:Dirigent protein 17 n=1 Tax=Sesamum angustifolium TaxID=2727405 RepID=A0AAW2N7C0_9LAMI
MEDKSNVDFIESSSAEVFEIPGEPAIVINGLPPLISRDADTLPCAVTDSQPQKLAVFGEWLEGREVRKLFGDRFFSGEVTQFDKEMGWYRVVYEDGDSEDLEWHELMEVLVPLDVNIPLKTLAIKIIKKRQKSAQKPTSKVRTRRNGSHDGKGKEKENDAS